MPKSNGCNNKSSKTKKEQADLQAELEAPQHELEETSQIYSDVVLATVPGSHNPYIRRIT